MVHVMSTSNAKDSRLYRDVAAILWMGGEDRLGFLERMSTNRLADLQAGQGRATVVTRDDGRAVDLVSCHTGAEGALLVTSAVGAAPALAEHLRRYVMFRDRVTITDARSQVDLLRLMGSGALSAAREVTGFDLEAGADRAGIWLERGEDDETVWLLGHPDPGGLGGIDLVLPAGDPADGMAARLQDAGARLGSASDYARERIAAAHPAFGHEIDGRFNPLELGLLDLVDFDKGCYIGQEVIARLANYDKVQRRLVRLEADAPPSPGARIEPILAEIGQSLRQAGVVTSVAPTADAGGWMAMAVVPRAMPDRIDVRVTPEHLGEGEPITARLLPAG